MVIPVINESLEGFNRWRNKRRASTHARELLLTKEFAERRLACAGLIVGNGLSNFAQPAVEEDSERKVAALKAGTRKHGINPFLMTRCLGRMVGGG